MLELNDLLAKAGIDPATTLVMRHRPQEPALRRVFAWIASERHDLFNAYQATQSRVVEKSLTRAQHVAALVGVDSGSAIFFGLYRHHGVRRWLTREDYWAIPEHRELGELGMGGFRKDDPRDTIAHFELERLAIAEN